ncbi:MAG: lipopolysaccharide transport periplasmic protein LptA [Bdellovibrio bacteriovorus]
MRQRSGPYPGTHRRLRASVRPFTMPGSRILAALGLVATLSPAWALKDDDKQPMRIEADQVELDESKSTSVYVGKVQVNQGSMRLTADHVTVYHHDDRRVKYIIALGQPATYRQLLDGEQGEVQAFAKRMDYDAVKDELVLTQEALLIQGTDRLSSERIVYDRAQERMRAGGSGRVKITITPEGEGPQVQGAPANPPPPQAQPVQPPASDQGQARP